MIRGIRLDIHAVAEEECESFFGILARKTSANTHASDHRVMSQAFCRLPFEECCRQAALDLAGVKDEEDQTKEDARFLQDASEMRPEQESNIRDEIGKIVDDILAGNYSYVGIIMQNKGKVRRSDLTSNTSAKAVQAMPDMTWLAEELLDGCVSQVASLTGPAPANSGFLEKGVARLVRAIDRRTTREGHLPNDVHSSDESASEDEEEASRSASARRVPHEPAKRSGTLGCGLRTGLKAAVRPTGGFRSHGHVRFPVVGVRTRADGSCSHVEIIDTVTHDVVGIHDDTYPGKPSLLVPRWSILAIYDENGNPVQWGNRRTMPRTRPRRADDSDAEGHDAGSPEEPDESSGGSSTL